MSHKVKLLCSKLGRKSVLQDDESRNRSARARCGSNNALAVIKLGGTEGLRSISV